MRRLYALQTLYCCTGLAGGWLGMMDILLRHHGYGTLVAATIVVQALLALAALQFRRSVVFYAMAMVGSLVVMAIALRALRAALMGADFEGYVLLIALALVVQAALTLLTLPGMRAVTAARGRCGDSSLRSE